MRTLNIFAKSIGIIFFFIFLLLTYKLATYSPLFNYELNIRNGAILLPMSAFISFLLSIFLIRLKSKKADLESDEINIRIVKFGFITIGIYALYQVIIGATNPWVLISFMELNFLLEWSTDLLYLILFIIKPLFYFSVSYFITRNHRWLSNLGFVALPYVLYESFKMVTIYSKYKYLGHDFSIYKDTIVYNTIFGSVIMVWALFSLIVLFKKLKIANTDTRN